MKPSTIWKIRGDQWSLIANGKTFSCDNIWIKWCEPAGFERDPVRLAFAISKKYGNAVNRNRFKRRTREIVRSHVKQNVLLKGKFLLVGVSKTSAREVSNSQIENAFLAFISTLK